MRLSTIGDKEIVNLRDGERFGQLSDAELLVDEKFGKIKAMLVPDFRVRKRMLGFGSKNYVEVPWASIKKIGNDIIIFESTDNFRY